METETNTTAHRFDRPTENHPEMCACGAAFVEGFNLQAVKVAHLAAFGVAL